MHIWGDEGVDWEGIGDAADFIGDYLRRWGRVNVTTTKEKWGRACVYCTLGWYSLTCITHPGHAFIRYKRDGILWRFNYNKLIISLIERLNVIVSPFHRWLYRRAYRLALARWPHLRREILAGCDYPELLEKEIESTNWTGVYGDGDDVDDTEVPMANQQPGGLEQGDLAAPGQKPEDGVH